jgi:hypothetical protein
MQYDPDAGQLLAAVAEWIQNDVRPILKEIDPALGFRALIAANLNRIVAGELATEDMLDFAELDRLRKLLPDHPAAQGDQNKSRPERRAAIAALNGAVTALIRDPATDEATLTAIREHLKASLAEKMAISNPRFSTALEIE